jgi:hypothetical protein
VAQGKGSHTREKWVVKYPPCLTPEDFLHFVHLDPFKASWKELKLSDDDLRMLELAIMVGPTMHLVMKGTGGLRKIRFARKNWKRGKSGGIRVGYAYFPNRAVVLLVTAWSKSDQEDLTEAGKKIIRRLIREVEEYFNR